MKKFNSLFKTKWLLVPLMLLTLSVGQMWGVEEYIFEESGGGSVDGWTFTNGTTTNDINQGSYWLLDAGSTKDYIITSAYDLSTYESATVYATIKSYGSGNTYPPLKIEISYNGGTTWAQSYTTSNVTSSNANYNVALNSTLTNNVKIRLSNNGNSGRGIRVTNFKLKVTYTPVNHTVNWYVNGSLARTQTALQGATLTEIPSPTSSNCDGKKSFVGWTETSDYTSETTAPTDLLTSTTGMTMPNSDKNYYAVFANVSGGVVTVTPSCTNKTSTGYESIIWTAESTDGDTYTGHIKVYSTSSNPFQVNNGQTPTFYNDDPFSGAITKIKIIKASGTDRSWTPRLSASTKQNSSSASKGTDLTAKSVGTSGATWDIAASNDYRYLYLGLAGGATYISSIEITYGGTTNYATSCCTPLGSINGSVSDIHPTSAKIIWDNVAHVDSWTLQKKASGESDFSDVWVSKTGSDSEITIYSDGGTNNKCSTEVVLSCGTVYSFKLIANPASGYCDASQVLDNNGSGYNSGKYQITMTGSGTVSNGTFTVNGEKAAKVYSCDGTNNVAIEATPATGYELNAWSIAKDASSTAISPADATASTTFSMPAEAVTVGVSFKAKKYAISYKDEGNNDYSGSNLASLPNEHTYNVATALVDGVKDGYSFVGWFTDEDCMESAGSSIAANSITAATTLYAKWAAAGTKRVTISAPSHGSISVTYTGMESPLTSGYRDIADNTELTITATPVDGYQLSSLKIDEDDFTSGNKHTLTAAITISATFSAIEYGITYYLDGGTNHKDNPAKYTIESAAITLGTPTKTGYTFGGWFINSDLAVGHEASTPAIAVASTGAKAFWAKWTANESTITWDANEGDVTPTSNKYTYDGSTVALPTPTRDHYVFDGWFTEVSGGTQITEIGTTNKPDADVTYHAQWHKENYTITWKVGGLTYTTGVSDANDNADYNNTVTAPTKPNDNTLSECQTNGKFMGWSGTKILSNDPVNGSSNISALGLFTTTSPAITQDTTFYAVFAKGTAGTSTATFDPSTTAGLTNSSRTWTHTASGITLTLAGSTTYSVKTSTTWQIGYNKSNTTENYLELNSSTNISQVDITLDDANNKVLSVTNGSLSTSSTTQTITGTFTTTKLYPDAASGKQAHITNLVVTYATTTYSDYITECAPLTCGAPTSPTKVEGKNGATLGWTAPTTGTAAKYQYAVWADGDDEPTSGYGEVTTTSASVSGLMSNTEYNWKVRAVCTGEDGESEFLKSTFSTGSVDLTFSVPAGVSEVAASTSASALPSAGVPESCAGCWVFAGWSTNANATSVEYNAGSTYKFNGDKTLYAVYGQVIGYKLIDNTTDLKANEYYVLTFLDEDEKEYALTNENHPYYYSSFGDALATEVTDKVAKVGDDWYLYHPTVNIIWKFTGTTSVGQLFNESASKYVSVGTQVLENSTSNLAFTVDDGDWTIQSASYYLAGYTSTVEQDPGFEASNESAIVYMYKRQFGSFATNIDCSDHNVTWHIIDATQVDENVSACDGVETLPSVDVADVRCKTENTVFMGWSETNIGYEPIDNAPADLFTNANLAPAITVDKNFYAVFAEATKTGTASKTVKYTVESTSTISKTGTAPAGASATYSQTHGTPCQMTKDNSATLTLKNWGTTRITQIVLSMKSNTTSGAGKLTYSTDGGTTLNYLVGSQNSGVSFNQSGWNGAWSTSYVDVTKNNLNITCVDGNDLVIEIVATGNSLYCESYEITYDEPVYSYDNYFTECCPQRTITLSGVDDEVGKHFEANVEAECAGETVTLTKTENGHYNFAGFTVLDEDEQSVAVTANLVSGEYTFTMPESAVTVTASWTAKNYIATITAPDPIVGSVEIVGGTVVNEQRQVPYGGELKVTASSADEDHFTFQNWTVSSNIPNDEEVFNDNPLTITMPGHNITVTANFGAVAYPALTLGNNSEDEYETDDYKLTVTLGNGGAIPNMAEVRSGTPIKVTYTLKGQHEFDGWEMIKTIAPEQTESFTTFNTDGNVATFNMPDKDLNIDLNVIAYYTLGLSATNGSISVVETNNDPQTVAASYNVYEGDIVEITAEPTNNTYKFKQWNKTGIEEANFDADGAYAVFTVGTANMTLEAEFEDKAHYDLKLMVCGKIQETINALEGTSVYSLVSAKEATELLGFTFMGWSETEDGAAISNNDLKLNNDKEVYAVYRKEAYYEKVTATSGITNGQYLIVYEDGNKAFNGGLSTLDASSNTISVTINGTKIVSNTTTDAASFTIAAKSGGYSIKSASNYYIGRNSSSNGLDQNSSDNYTNSISVNAAGVVTITCGTTNYLRFNNSSGQKRFRYFNSDSQQVIQLYKKIVPEDNESNPSTVVVSGEELVISEASTLNNLTVEAGGTVSGSAALTVNNLTINSEPSKSGQVTGSNVSVNGDIYLDIKLLDGTGYMSTEQSQMWYCISAPFDVNMNGGFFWGDGTPMGHNVDFQAFVYDGGKRASNGTSGWQRVGGKLEANKAYLIGFDDEKSNQKTIRLKAMSKDIPTASQIDIDAHDADDANKNWNGVGNPTLHYIALDGFSGKVQCYNNGAGYSPYDPATHNYVVGTTLFMQAENDIDLKAAENENFRAPKRVNEENERYSFCVEIAKEGATRCDNRLYVSTSNEATLSYEPGKDMLSMNGTSAKFAALIWTENYGKRLASEDVPMVNKQATYTLGVYAPKAGTYSISTVEASEDAELFLTKDGAIIWNLSMGAYEVELAQGQNAGYGMLLRAKAPSVVTGVDQIDAKAGAQKVIIDEHVYILRGGQMYDVNGKMVK